MHSVVAPDMEEGVPLTVTARVAGVPQPLVKLIVATP
jgi:hypothetical protein